ncbi:MAG: hypothetical protein JJ916_12345 [Phycisphaerales bacterium]|nr:hypothetical protein [Phycisphaerales bacterium]
MQISAEPKGWSDAEVDELLDSVASIDAKLNVIEQTQLNSELALVNSTVAAVAVTTAVYAIVLLISIYIGWTISHYFLPSPKDIAP